MQRKRLHTLRCTDCLAVAGSRFGASFRDGTLYPRDRVSTVGSADTLPGAMVAALMNYEWREGGMELRESDVTVGVAPDVTPGLPTSVTGALRCGA